MSRVVPPSARDPDGIDDSRRMHLRCWSRSDGLASVTGLGYGVQDPGRITTSLEWIFGPRDPFVSEPRLAISVGSGFPTALTDPPAALPLRSHLAARRDPLSHRLRG
jgi:hypothetical protein